MTWRVAKYGDPYSEFLLCSQPIQSAHTQQWTHTHREHTPGAVGSQCCGARGAVGGTVPYSRVSPQSWYWRRREHWLFTPPHRQFLPDLRLEPMSLGLQVRLSLSIRPRLPPWYQLIQEEKYCDIFGHIALGYHLPWKNTEKHNCRV